MDTIERLKNLIQDLDHATDMVRYVRPHVFPPVDRVTVQTAENFLGFGLPDLLRDIYVHVANGGFGPGYGLIGIQGGASDDQGNTIEVLYHLYHQANCSDPYWIWPKGLVPVCYWGCAIYTCVDCAHLKAPVVVFDPNVHEEGQPWETSFFSQMASFDTWITAWLDGADLRRRGASIQSSLEHHLKQLLAEGKVISAIIAYQKEKGCSLVEAKRTIEMLESRAGESSSKPRDSRDNP